MFLMNYDRVITHKGASFILSEKMMKQAADFSVSVERFERLQRNSGLQPRSQNQIPLTHHQGLRND
jgi:hypothetical protein